RGGARTRGTQRRECVTDRQRLCAERTLGEGPAEADDEQRGGVDTDATSDHTELRASSRLWSRHAACQSLSPLGPARSHRFPRLACHSIAQFAGSNCSAITGLTLEACYLPAVVALRLRAP